VVANICAPGRSGSNLLAVFRRRFNNVLSPAGSRQLPFPKQRRDMRFPLGEMTVGDILDRGLKLLFARLPVFYAVNLLVQAPLIVIQLALPLVLFGGQNALDMETLFAYLGLLLVAALVAAILQPIATAAILHIVMEEYAGRRASIGAALSFALSRFFPLLGASILFGLMYIIGIFLCCIPGIYVMVVFAFVGQVVVLERLGVGESFQRSQKLVEGFWWRVFGVLILIGIANGMIQGGLAQVLNFVLPAQEMIPMQNGIQMKFNAVNHIIDTTLTQLVHILLITYSSVCTTLLYLDLRIRKEGFDLELAAGADPSDRPRRRRYDDEYEEDRDREYDDDDRPRRRGRDDDDYDDRDDRDRDRPWQRGRGNDDDDRGDDRGRGRRRDDEDDNRGRDRDRDRDDDRYDDRDDRGRDRR
jgi:hypothetical protein